MATNLPGAGRLGPHRGLPGLVGDPLGLKQLEVVHVPRLGRGKGAVDRHPAVLGTGEGLKKINKSNYIHFPISKTMLISEYRGPCEKYGESDEELHA